MATRLTLDSGALIAAKKTSLRLRERLVAAGGGKPEIILDV
jgi:hypothetical protein